MITEKNHKLLTSGLTTHSKKQGNLTLAFLSPLPHVPLPFTKMNIDLKMMQLTSLE
jgi:hypothetical protein